MSVRLSSSLAELPVYVPGQSVPGAIKLASNETPYPPLPYVLSRIAESAGSINRYPDTGATQLCERLAVKFGVGPAQVAVGCGSVSLCGQLVRASTDVGDEVIYAWRSFEAYPIVAALSGATSVQVPLRDYRHDLDAMAEAITERTRLIFVCNPNNPTGTVVTRDELAAFLARVPPDVTVALDEAYTEFVRDPSVPDGMDLLAVHPNLIVLRTFSKAYGLAGLRVGYAVSADEDLVTAIKRTQLPFVVTQIGQDAALASLEPRAERELLERVQELVGERERVRGALLDYGYDIPPSQANFVWFPLGPRSSEFAARCAEQKLITRAFAGDGVRVTVGSRTENDQLLAAAAQLADQFAG